MKQSKSTVRGETKLSPNYCYIFDAQMNFTNPILDSSTVTELNIYDVLSPPLTPRNLLYRKTFDYNKQDTDGDDTCSYISMCVPIYDNPAPLTKSGAPKLFEWNNIDEFDV